MSSPYKPFWRTEPSSDATVAATMSSADPDTKDNDPHLTSKTRSSSPASQAMPPPPQPPALPVASSFNQQPTTPHKVSKDVQTNTVSSENQNLTPQKSPYNTNVTQAAAAPFKPPTPSKAPANLFTLSRITSIESIPEEPKDEIKGVELNSVARKELEKQGSGGVGFDAQGGRNRLVKRAMKEGVDIFGEGEAEDARSKKLKEDETGGDEKVSQQPSQRRSQTPTAQPQFQQATQQSAREDQNPGRFFFAPNRTAAFTQQTKFLRWGDMQQAASQTSPQPQTQSYSISRHPSQPSCQPPSAPVNRQIRADAGPPSGFKAAPQMNDQSQLAPSDWSAMGYPTHFGVNGEDYEYDLQYEPLYPDDGHYYGDHTYVDPRHNAQGDEAEETKYAYMDKLHLGQYEPTEEDPFDPTAPIPVFDVKSSLTEPWDKMQNELPPFLTTYAEELLGNTYDLLFMSAALFHKLNKSYQSSLTHGVEAIKAEEVKQEKAREVIVQFSAQMRTVAGVLGNFGLDSQMDEIMGARR